jgi:putative transposase
MQFDLTDEEWGLLEPLLPTQRKSARADDRRVLNAIFYVLRAGIPWRDLPERYGPYTTAYNRFNRWSRRGMWTRIFDRLASKSRDRLHLIDSTIVKAHRAASGARGEKAQAIGISRGGRSTKIHACVDSRGRPLNFVIAGGQVHDSQAVEELLGSAASGIPIGSNLVSIG